MYKQVKTDLIATLEGGGNITPVATLCDESGGRAQIHIDDHCYVLTLQRDMGYISTAWIFPEAFEVLKTLPSLKPA
jgi:hypothetical protein